MSSFNHCLNFASFYKCEPINKTLYSKLILNQLIKLCLSIDIRPNLWRKRPIHIISYTLDPIYSERVGA